MIEPSHELWLFVSSWLVVVVDGLRRFGCICTDQIVVGDPTRLPSFFQSSHHVPELSLNKSGSMLPPSDAEP